MKKINFKTLLLAIGLVVASQNAMAWWYINGDISGSWTKDDSKGQMNSNNEITFYAKTAGTYYFRLYKTDAGGPSGSNQIKNTEGNIETGCNNDGAMWVKFSETMDVYFKVVDETNWQIKIVGTPSPYYIKYNWNNADWGWSAALTDNGDGTYSCSGKYGGTSFDYNRKNSDDGKTNATASTVGGPSNGDNCIFTFNPSTNSLVIRKCNTVSKTNHVYFDNSKAQWNDSHMQFAIGYPTYSTSYGLTKITNTNLYYVAVGDDWSDAGYYAVFGGSSAYSGHDWSIKNVYDATHHSKAFTSQWNLQSGKVTLITKANGSNKGDIALNYHETYEDFNKTQTVKVMVKKAGASNYTEETTFANWPGSIKAKRYKLNSNGASSATETNQDITSTATFTSVITSEATLTATANSGYAFRGFNTTNSVPGSVTNPYSYTVSDETTTYAFFEEVTYSVTFGVGTDYTSFGSVKASVNNGEAKDAGSYSIGASSKVVFTATPATGYEVEGWYSNAACTSAKLQTGGNSYTIASLAKVETVYVKFKAKTYNITYKDQGNVNFSGSHEAGHPTTHTYDQATTLKGATKTGYEFQGWHKQSDCSDAAISTIGGTDYTANFTLYAKWQVNNYNISHTQGDHYTMTGLATSANFNTTANFTATPAKGYRLKVTATYGSNVNVPLTHDDFSYDYSFTIPAGDVTINVTAYRYGLAYGLSSSDFDSNNVVCFNETTDQIVLSNLAAHSVYKFKLYNEAYTSSSSSHFMGNEEAWPIYENKNNMVPSVGGECFYINTGSEGNYVISLGDNSSNKPSINVTYPDVCKINIDNKDYALTQVGETNIYETELIQLNRDVNYWFYLYWHGPRLGDQNGNTMSNTNHNGWKYESKYYDKQSILSTHNTPKSAHYKFQFDASNNNLTVIYPSAISGGFPDQDWNDNYTLVFDGNVGTRMITLVASQSAIGFKVVDDGVFYGAQSTNITATAQNIQLTASNESSYDMNLTPILDGNYTFTYDRSTHKLSVEYPTSTETFDVTVYEDGITSKIINVGLTPATITAVVPVSMAFDKWEKEGAVTINDAYSAATTITATGAGASVRAVFKTQNTIYFKDNAGWGDVWLHFYSSNYWDDNKGSGSKNIQHSGMHATKIDNTDIWYFDKSSYTGWTTGKMAYTNIQASGHDNFNFVNCSYFDGTRGKSVFNDATPLFVVHNYITDYKNQSQYYLEGVWMKYNSTESGFDLRGKNTSNDKNDNSITWDANQHKFTAPTPGEYTFSTTLHLLGNQTYEMRIYDAAERWYSLNGDMMTSTSCTNWKLHLGHDGNFKVKTTSEGDYVFTISVGGGEMLLSITYPLSDGDYRVVYVENATQQTNGYLIKKISEGTQKDTASFFIATGATGQVKLQQCTNASTQTWADVSPAQSINISGYTNGVYNFVVTQDGSSTTLSKGGKYTGDFYIRTEGVDGGKEGFKSNADNKLTAYASMLDAGVTYSNFQYNYYKTKWVSSGKNVSFCVANDYSKNISSEFGSDAIIDPVQTPTKETLPQSANVRFMWNSETNTLSRAYISGSTDISARFLVLEGDAKMFDKEGKALTQAGGGKISGLNDNELNFTDKNNWVYQADIKAQPGCAVKLTANYNNQVQYFLGASDASHQIISGSGDTKYTMRVVYDFKTNRLTAGWVPDKNQHITDTLDLGGDMLLVREHQGDANQITFGDKGEVTNIKHIYGVLTIRKDTMLGAAGTIYPEAATNADYSRTMYWISFPFKVKISEIFGLDGYGTKWIIQKYNGKKRADIGWFKEDTPTFWEFMEYDETLNAYEGYLFLIDATYFNKSSADVWDNSATEVNFYFPSASGEIGIIKADTYPQDVDAHACSIDREFEVTDSEGHKTTVNHKNTDSYWNVIGVPAFQNTTAGATPISGGLNAYYEWIPSNNTYRAETVELSGVTFKTMHAYMVQFGGRLTWSNVSVVSNKAPYRYADEKNYMVELIISNNEAEDKTFVKMTDEANTDFVLNEDMMKLDNAGYPNIYSFAGNYNVAYNETKMDNQSVMLGVSAPKAGTYTFSMPKEFSGTAKLVDLVEGITTDLNVSNYSVDLNKGTYNNRFQLLLEVEAKAPTSIQADRQKGREADGKTQKLLRNGNIYLINAGRVYNATGAELR